MGTQTGRIRDSIRRARKGDRIVLVSEYEQRSGQSAKLFAHPDGALVAEMNRINGIEMADCFLNGEPFGSGYLFNQLYPHAQGAAWCSPERRWNVVGNSKEAVHFGSSEGWRWHPQGFAIPSGEAEQGVRMFFLNGKAECPIGPCSASIPYRPTVEGLMWHELRPREDGKQDAVFWAGIGARSFVAAASSTKFMTGIDDWHPYYSDQVIIKVADGELRFYAINTTRDGEWKVLGEAVLPCFGIHPWSHKVYEYGPDDFAPEKLCLNKKFIRLGKLGFDPRHERGIIAHEVSDDCKTSELALHVLC